MISKMLYEKEIKHNINSYLYDNDFLLYFVSKKLLKSGPSSGTEIKKWIMDKTSTSNINLSQFTKFLSHFTENNSLFYLKPSYIEVLKKVNRFDSDFLILSWETQEKIYKGLCSNIGCLNFNIEKVLPYSLALFKISEGKSQEYYSSLFFTNLINYDDNYLKLDHCVSLIDEGYKKLTIDFIFTDKIVVDMLFANGITTLNDLTELSIDSLLVIFSRDIDYYISILSTLHDDFLLTYKHKISELIEQLNEKEKDIISLRNGFNGHKKKTLEEIGESYGITRERIRQIEAKGMKKMCSNLHLTNTIFASIYFNLILPNEKYITKEKFKDFVNDDGLAYFITLLMSESESYITYDTKLEIIYNKKVASIEEIENEIIDVYGDYLLVSDFNSLDDFEKKIVQNNYRIVNGNIYLRKGVFERKLITNVIDDLFPEGYHISDNITFIKIQEEYKKRYGCWDEGLNSRLISTYTERENYCQIDKGTYKNRKYVPSIDQFLKDRIINYILENQPTVFYESIYKHFKSELNELGIDNYYYLKGVIDNELPPEFSTKRNYIQIGETKLTSGEAVVSFIKSFNRAFAFDEIKTRFEGIKDYIITNYLYSEIDNGLIWLSSKKFIYFSKANISEVTIQKLDKYLLNLFETLNTKVMSSRKVFSRMMLTNKPLLDDLKIIDDQFSMFSLLKYLYGDKYYFSRPLISLDKDGISSQESVVREYVSKLDKFNLKLIKSYQAKLSLRGLYSYLEFMEDMSDDYTQVNVDTMVKKELLGVTDNFIKEFSEMFSLIFSKSEIVDTRKFNGYMLLPSLEYKWNKYLLVGVIRTYFNDVYEVENTSQFYNYADFIIRKIK